MTLGRAHKPCVPGARYGGHDARDDSATRLALRRFAIATVAPRFQQLGWDGLDGESVNSVQMRAALAQSLV